MKNETNVVAVYETCGVNIMCTYSAIFILQRNASLLQVYLSLLLHNVSATTELRLKEWTRKPCTLWSQLLPVFCVTLHVVYVTPPSAAQTICSVQCRIISEIWTGHDLEGSGRGLTRCTISLFFLRGWMTNLTQDMRCPDRDLNPATRKQKSELNFKWYITAHWATRYDIKTNKRT